MRYDEFIRSVERRASLPQEEAEALTRATLATLAERITGGEVRDLASQLPKEMQPALIPPDQAAEDFNLEEFMRRVQARADVNKRSLDRGVPAVFATLREAVAAGEFRHLMEQLPKEFQQLAAPVTY